MCVNMYFVWCASDRCIYFMFFFFKQKTAYEMRISDWSSDVCSSDLQAGASDAEIAATMERVRALTEEKKILQDIFGDQSDPTAEMRKGFEDLRNTIVDVDRKSVV